MSEEQFDDMPTIVLNRTDDNSIINNNLRVWNFSSYHPFNFSNGDFLPGCSEERANRLMLDVTETEEKRSDWTDISIRFEMSKVVYEELIKIIYSKISGIIIVPLPVLSAMKIKDMDLQYSNIYFRTCRVVDRTKKLISPWKFCY